jgi:CBS domain-containing protein
MPRKELEWKFRHKWAPITVEENMSRQLVTVGPAGCVSDIAKLMRDEVVGCVVVEKEGDLIGIVTDRDITVKVTAEGRDPQTTTARDIMAGDVAWCFEDDNLTRAAEIMANKRVRRLPVLSGDRKLVGLLTADDLVWHTDNVFLGRVFEHVSEPHA